MSLNRAIDGMGWPRQPAQIVEVARQAKRRVFNLPSWLFTLAARWNLPWIAALLTRAFIRIEPPEPSTGRTTARTVLMLPRAIFIEDVTTVFGSRSDFRIARVPNYWIKSLARAYLPDDIDDNSYVRSDQDGKDRQTAYRQFLEHMWPRLHRLLRIDVVVTANFAYHAERELATALENLGTPFVAMYKECFKSPGYVQFAKDVYEQRRGRFTGRRVLVYNRIEQNLLADTDVMAVDGVTVCGMPRLDRIHAWRRQVAGQRRQTNARPMVLFFSFPTGVGLPRLSRKAAAGFAGNTETLPPQFQGLSFENLARNTHEAMLTLARDNPDIDVVVKSKVHKRHRTEMEALVGPQKDLPPNLEIVAGGDPFALIARCDVACGFNSTALLETIAAGKPVVVPVFSEAAETWMAPFVRDMGTAVEYATSEHDLVVRLAQTAREIRSVPAELDDRHKAILDHWVGNADGCAARRVRQAIEVEVSPAG